MSIFYDKYEYKDTVYRAETAYHRGVEHAVKIEQIEKALKSQKSRADRLETKLDALMEFLGTTTQGQLNVKVIQFKESPWAAKEE